MASAVASAPASLFEVVRRLAAEQPDVVAAVDGDLPGAPSIKYAELSAEAERLSRSLHQLIVEHRGWVGSRELVIATHMRRGCDWYATFCAATRLQVPVVALSTDLSKKSDEEQRNKEILEEHRPVVLVTDSPDEMSQQLEQLGDSKNVGMTIRFQELRQRQTSNGLSDSLMPSADATLCFCYTGGTTRASRCARVTHRQALHELEQYPSVCGSGTLFPTSKVLQQHSMFWAASAYGEVDIALAFGCALVFTEAVSTEEVATAIATHGINCAGLVPHTLAALDPAELPTLKCVLTWGEALQERVALEWAQRVRLIDLLISTECWLSLYADWNRDATGQSSGINGRENAVQRRPAFRTVPGAKVCLRPLANAEAPSTSGAGELLISGPMVCPGYTSAGASTDAFHKDDMGDLWYCTKDCLAPSPDGCGYMFAGRADDMLKVGGAWVDIREVEQKVAATDGVQQASIGQNVAYVSLSSQDAVPAIRRQLPPDFALFIVPEIPRRPGTGKVDRARLEALTGGLSGPRVPRELADEEEKKICEQRASLLKWYRPLYVVVFATLLHAAWATYLTAENSLTQASQIGWFLGRCLLEIIWRLVCLSHLVRSVILWNSSVLIDFMPFGRHGLAVLVCSAIPSPLWFFPLGLFIWFCIVAHGAREADGWKRMIAWPLVFAVGFPVWAREEGRWWATASGENIRKWYRTKGLPDILKYLQDACVGSCRFECFEAPSPLRKRVKQCARCIGLMKKCNQCKTLSSTYSGSKDPADGVWYCKQCWRSYHDHKECFECKKWRSRGQQLGDKWVCGACARKLKEVESGVSEAEDKQETDKAMEAMEQDKLRPADDGKSAPADEDVKATLQSYRRRDQPQRIITILENVVSAVGAENLDYVTNEHADPNFIQGAGLGNPEPVAHKTAEWRILERVLGPGWPLESRASQLIGVDSLRVAKIVSALRREASIKLTRHDLLRCSNLGQFLDLLEALPRSAPAHTRSSADASAAVAVDKRVWGIMWKSGCAWTIKRDKPLSEAAFRATVDGLVKRHSALRARIKDPLHVFTATQKALTWLECVRWQHPDKPRKEVGLRARARRWLDSLVQWAFWTCWGRVRIVTAEDSFKDKDPITVYNRMPTFEDARYKAQHTRLAPPFIIAYAPYGEEGSANDGVVIYINITHMLSDGFSIVPLLTDLAQLVDAEETGTPANLAEAAPEACDIYEKRIRRTLTGDWTYSERVTVDQIRFKRTWKSTAQYAAMPLKTLQQLRLAARRYAIPDETIMLAALGVTFARLEEKKDQSIVIIAPQRDDQGASEMVALMADNRRFTVSTGGLNYLGVATQIHHVIKERLWQSSGICTQQDRPLINFEWTDFETRSGFTQHVDPHWRPENMCNAAKVSVDQIDRDTWRIQAIFDTYAYPEEKNAKFFDLFEDTLRKMCLEPLTLVWPDDE